MASVLIAERYYHGEHYVWCAYPFGPDCVRTLDSANPPSSSPGEIYSSLLADVLRGDRHSAMIERNKVGILRGASHKKTIGVIGEKEETEIAAIVDCAQILDFRPVLYIIPYALVSHIVTEVPPSERAHPLSS